MRTLAIECATEACSIALIDGGKVVAADHRLLGRGHAEHLVPMIAALPDRGHAAEIMVSLGPGSFTGVRIGIAVAKALGVAWGSTVLGYPTLALVATMAAKTGALLPGSQGLREPPDVLVCMNGGHGQWFVQPFSPAREPSGPCRSLTPEEAVAQHRQPIVVGSRALEFVALRGWGEPDELLPDAAWSGWIPRHLLTSQVTPIYGREPDARLPA
jgi:tRNA threonylcarbamoyladenosine biosynthesis protein TsaB